MTSQNLAPELPAGRDRDRSTDVGDGDLPPERLGADFFPYQPFWVLRQAQRQRLALITNLVQRALDSGAYSGAVWLEGSPSVEESAFWLSLLIDTHLPISCNASQWPHGALANDGDHNIVDSVEYIVSRVWADADGRDRVGVVMCQDGQIFAAREVQKADARPGGYITTGGHGGILGRIADHFPPTRTTLTFIPARRHTATSGVNLRQLPMTTSGGGALGRAHCPGAGDRVRCVGRPAADGHPARQPGQGRPAVRGRRGTGRPGA